MFDNLRSATVGQGAVGFRLWSPRDYLLKVGLRGLAGGYARVCGGSGAVGGRSCR